MSKIKFVVLSMFMSASSCLHAACPDPDGGWEVNFNPTSAAASKNDIIFANNNLLIHIQGASVELLFGQGLERYLTEGRSSIVRIFDKAFGTVSMNDACRLQFRINATENYAIVDTDGTERGVPVQMNAKLDPSPLMKGFAGVVTLTEKGRKVKHTIVMTRISN